MTSEVKEVKQQPPRDDVSPSGTPRAWVRYRIEHRHPTTSELVHRQDVDKFTTESIESNSNDPAFEVVATYRTRSDAKKSSEHKSDSGTEDSASTLPPTSVSTPSYHMNIYSAAIINALQSVVRYYPSQDLTGDIIVVRWPYPVIVHHYKELSELRNACASKDPSELCSRQRDALEHLGILLEYMDENIMEGVYAEQERNKKGFYTFDHWWVSHKPGATKLYRTSNDRDWHPRVIHSVRGGIFDNPPTHWTIIDWNLRFDGQDLSRCGEPVHIAKFDGEKNVSSALLFVEDDDFTQDECVSQHAVVVEQYKYGREYWDLLQKQCKHYKGKSCEFPFNQVDGLVMTDLRAYYAENPHDKPKFMGNGDLRNWTSDCACTFCSRENSRKQKQVKPLFDDYNNITLEFRDSLKPHQYFLCPFEMKSFIFSTRTWETLHVGNFSNPVFEEDMIKNLVMKEESKKMLKALSKSFARLDQDGKVIPRDMWTADFVQGKGNGLVFLLHGRPGVGKTCTAECIAAFTKRPLMTLTMSDIGIDAATVERQLTSQFRTARSWGAVLLIDEADVFMEQRNSDNLLRNSLVASFLRALEYYNGILFLTTNRVGSFDDAFISRIHVQLYYPDLDDDQRQKVWKTFIDKLTRDRGKSVRLTVDAKEYINGQMVRGIKWNGREIRNVFQTAVALAEYDAEKDEDGKICVTDSHFRPVVEMSQNFKDYLHKLHRGDESKRAERKYERLDSFEK